MKAVAELAAGAVPAVTASPRRPGKADTSQYSAVRRVFGRMHANYGSPWLDKWRTSVLDAKGDDLGVKSAMVVWSQALAEFDLSVIEEACNHVLDPERRSDYKFPPSLPELLAECRSLVPHRPPPVALPNKMSENERRVGRERLAAIKAQAMKGISRPRPLDSLHYLITEAVQNAGGSLDELTTWHPAQHTTQTNQPRHSCGGPAIADD